MLVATFKPNVVVVSQSYANSNTKVNSKPSIQQDVEEGKE